MLAFLKYHIPVFCKSFLKNNFIMDDKFYVGSTYANVNAILFAGTDR